MMSRVLPLAVALIFTLVPAAPAKAKGAASYQHQLMVSEGVAHPAYSALAGSQNPAGLMFNNGAQLHIDSQSATTGIASPDFGGDLLFGAPGWGGGVGMDWNTDGGTDGTDGYVANFGLSGYLQGLQTAFGISGSTGISNAQGTNLDLGILIGPFERVTLGFTAYGVTGGIDNLGAGFDLTLGRGISFVTDILTDTSFDGFHFQPGIWLGSQKASLTVSVGLDTGSGGGGGSDFSLGGQMMLGRRINWQIYYQQINKLYTGLSFAL